MIYCTLIADTQSSSMSFESDSCIQQSGLFALVGSLGILCNTQAVEAPKATARSPVTLAHLVGLAVRPCPGKELSVHDCEYWFPKSDDSVAADYLTPHTHRPRPKCSQSQSATPLL